MKKIYLILMTLFFLGCTSVDENGFYTSGNKIGLNKKTNTAYDENGFSKYGYNKENYNKYGYDLYGYDREGYNKYGYNKSGYDREGYNVKGYSREGYNRLGYTKEGWDIKGINKETGTEYDKEGYDKLGYDKEGWSKSFNNKYTNSYYDKEGYNKSGYTKEGWSKSFSYNKYTSGYYDKEGYDREGYNKEGYNWDGYDKSGYDKSGYDWDGYDKSGYDKSGYNKEGYDNRDFDKNEINKFTKTSYDKLGYDKEGYDREGYDKLEWGRSGFNKYTKTKYNKTGYDKNGFNELGLNKDTNSFYNKEGFDILGYNSYGENKNEDKLDYSIKWKRDDIFNRSNLNEYEYLDKLESSIETLQEKKLTEIEKRYLEIALERKKIVLQEIKGNIKNIIITYDEFKDVHWYYTQYDIDKKYKDYPGIYIGENKKEKWLIFNFSYYSSDWLFIEKVTLKSDTDMITLYPVGNVLRDVLHGGEIKEVFESNVTNDINKIKKIVNSENFKIRLEGTDYYEDFDFSSDELMKNNINSIINKYNELKK